MRYGSAIIVRRALLSILLLAGVQLAGCTSMQGSAPAPSAEQRQSLAPSGKLKVGLYPGTPTSILPDPAPPRGVGYELGRELARRLGVPFAPVVFAKNADVLDAVKGGQVDIAFTNASAERARDMDFTTPYLEIELGYLVASGAPIATIDEVDQPGIRVAVTAKSSSDAVLSRDLKNAVVVRALTVKAGVEMLSSGKAEAYATNKATLFEMADELQGSRVLAGRWGVERHAIAVPKGRAVGLSFAQVFAEAAKAEGLVRDAAARAGLRGTLETLAK